MTVSSSTHRELAIFANNAVWEILSKPAREISDAEAEVMTQLAYTAAFHWQRAEGAMPCNEARASWLLSRVWATRNFGSLALPFAQQCFAICQKHGLVDFDLAYAHESMARSFACLGEKEQALHHLAIAKSISIKDDDDRALLLADIVAEPWFGCYLMEG